MNTNTDLTFEIIDLAISVAQRQIDGYDKGDPFFALTLSQIIQKAAQAYQEQTGRPLDPSLIKAEDPA